jgi:hypothetical protein
MLLQRSLQQHSILGADGVSSPCEELAHSQLCTLQSGRPHHLETSPRLCKSTQHLLLYSTAKVSNNKINNKINNKKKSLKNVVVVELEIRSLWTDREKGTFLRREDLFFYPRSRSLRTVAQGFLVILQGRVEPPPR